MQSPSVSCAPHTPRCTPQLRACAGHFSWAWQVYEFHIPFSVTGSGMGTGEQDPNWTSAPQSQDSAGATWKEASFPLGLGLLEATSVRSCQRVG